MWSYAQFFSTNTRKTKKRMRNVTLQSWNPGWHTCTTSANEIYNRQCWVLLTLVSVSVPAQRYAIFICSLDVEIDDNLSSYIYPGLGLDLSLVLAWVLYFFLLKCCRSFGVCLGVCRSIELCLRGRGGGLKVSLKLVICISATKIVTTFQFDKTFHWAQAHLSDTWEGQVILERHQHHHHHHHQ